MAPEHLTLKYEEKMMVRVSVMYPTTPGGRFDMDYYKTKHAELIAEKLTDPGYIRFEIDQGLGGAKPGVPPKYMAIGHMIFTDTDAFQRLMGEHGRSLNEDVPNFTNIRAEIQVSGMVM